MNASTAHELLNIIVNKAMHTGKTGAMNISIPYSDLTDHPDQPYNDIDLKITISTEWTEKGENDE